MPQAIEELFRLYYQDVYTYLYSLCRDPRLAEDLASETFLQALRGLAAFRGQADIKTWLLAIGRRQWFGHLKAQRRRPQTEALREFCPAPACDVEQLCQTRALARRVMELLAAEPPRTQAVVKLRLAGYSFYEIGLAQHISEGSARVIDFRAKAKIRAALEQEGF